MNRLKSQRLKRARRQAMHEARHANKTTPVKADPNDVVIYATREGNVYRRKWMKKRGLLRDDVAVTFADAMVKVPVFWRGNITVNFPPGSYGFRPVWR